MNNTANESKHTLYTELSYLLGLVILAFGTALMERADFGMSMVVAPAYVLYLKISQFLPFFTFGMAEYCLQAVLLIALCASLRRFKIMYLFSFVTAVIYGLTLDGLMALAAHLPMPGLGGRLVFYFAGMVLCAIGVALLFHTYLAPEAYELMVKELSEKTARPLSRVKTAYDCISCAVAVVLSFLFFGLGHFEGVKAGTIFCALINGSLIGIANRLLERRFAFRDGFKHHK